MKQMNFNRKENQHRCVHHSILIKNWEVIEERKPPYRYRHVIYMVFVASRNYGWGVYKGVLYNLNQEWQANHFLNCLIEEGFLSVKEDVYTIHDSDYIGFNDIKKHHLLWYLGLYKLNRLTIEECELIDNIVTK